MALKALSKSPALSHEEAVELLPKLRAGDKAARERMMLGHAKLIFKLVNDVVKQRRLDPEMHEELESVALLKLVESVDELAKTPAAEEEFPAAYLREGIAGAVEDAIDANSSLNIPPRTVRRRRSQGDNVRRNGGTGPKPHALPGVVDGEVLDSVGVDVHSEQELREEILACTETPGERAVIGTLMMGAEVPTVAKINNISEKHVYHFRRRVLRRFEDRRGVTATEVAA